MKKLFYTFILVASVFIGSVLLANAASIFDITYPIAELGGCENQQACKVYCDDLANKDACLAFAEKFGLVAKEKVEQGKKMPPSGPGGCKSAEECHAYCDNPDNEEACLAFAEKYGMKIEGPRGQEVAERARLIKEQGGPGNCQSQKECRAYCGTPANQKECLDFAEKHNLIDKKELKAARKVMESGGPGGCRSKEACEAYCENPDNMMECVKFAEEHNLIDAKEAEMVKKMPPVGPGGCRGKECKTYCDNPEHSEECLVFAEKNGLMPKEELERAKKLAGKSGPGGCRGQKECDAFCGNPDNQEACFQFAVDNDLMPREEIERAKKMKEAMREGGPGGCRGPRECRAYCENPENQEKCFEFAKEHKMMPPEEIERMKNAREMNDKVRGMGGPGGCKSENECRIYCGNPEHVEECLAFAVKMGGMNVDEAEGKLKTFIEEAHGGGMMPPAMGGLGMPGQGAMMPPPDMMGEMSPEKFREIEKQRFERFEQFRRIEMPPMMDSPSAVMNIPGPGGCDSPESCLKYCADPSHRSECAGFNPSAGAPPPGEIFRRMEPDSERGFRRDGATTTLFGARPQFGESGEGSVCSREYHPVCGSNNRTYPNECFAKKDNALIVKDGPCGGIFENEFRPEGAMPPEAFRKSPEGFNSAQGGIMPPPDGFIPEGAPQTQTQPSPYPSTDQFRQYQPQQSPQYVPQYTQPPIIPEQQYTPPQSRRVGSSLLSNLLQAFSNALRMR